MYLFQRMKNYRWWISLPWILLCIIVGLMIMPLWIIQGIFGKISNLSGHAFTYVHDIAYDFLKIGSISNWVFEKERNADEKAAWDDL